jgi:two-component system response regulator MprA
MKSRVLVVDDDPAIRSSLQLALDLEGYQVAVAADGAEALTAMREDRPDVLVLDLMMPGIDGLTVCRVLRAEKDRMPILMLTARTETSDRVEGLDAGADDYLPKPFDLEELLARLRALLRRTQPQPTGAGGNGTDFCVGGLCIDPSARRAWCGEHEFELSKTEFDLLELLMRNEGIVLEHSTIYDRIWGYDFGPDSKNLAVYISYLRRKLAEAGCDEMIKTVRGVGYALRAT